MSGAALMFVSIDTKKPNSTSIRHHLLLNYSSIGVYLYDTIRQLLPFFVLLFASTTIDAQTIDDVTKVLFDNKEICGNPFGDPKWVPALDKCIQGCDIRTQLCLESDELLQRCDQLPDRCIDLLKSRFGDLLSTTNILQPQSKPMVSVVQQLNQPSTSSVIPSSISVSTPPSPSSTIENRFQSVTPSLSSSSVADVAVQQNPELVLIAQQTVFPQQPQPMVTPKNLPELQFPTSISPIISLVNSANQPSSSQQLPNPNQPQMTIQPDLNELSFTLPPPAAPVPIAQPPPPNWSSQLYPPIPPVQENQQNEFYQGQLASNNQQQPLAPYQQQTPDSTYLQNNYPAPMQQPDSLSYGNQQTAAPIIPNLPSEYQQQQQTPDSTYSQNNYPAPMQQPDALSYGNQQTAAPIIPNLPSEYQQAPSNAIQPPPSLFLVVPANPVDYIGGSSQPSYVDIDQQQSAMQPTEKYIYFKIETEQLGDAYLSSLNENEEVHIDLPTIDDSIDAKPELYPSMNSDSYPSVAIIPSNSPSSPSDTSDIIVVSEPTNYATASTVLSDYYTATDIANNPILLPSLAKSALYVNRPTIVDIIDVPVEPYSMSIVPTGRSSMHLSWNDKLAAYGLAHRKLNRASGTS